MKGNAQIIRWRAQLVLAAGAIALAFAAYWTPRYHPAAAKGFPTYAMAQPASNDLGALLNLDVRGWSTELRGSYFAQRAFLYAHQQPGQVVLPPNFLRITRRDPATGRSLRLDLGPDGVTNFSIDNWRERGPNRGTEMTGAMPAKPYTREAAELLLRQITPANWGFQFENQTDEGPTRTFTWKSRSQPECRALLRIAGGTPVFFRLLQEPPEAQKELFQGIDSRQSLLEALASLLVAAFLLTNLAMVIFLVQMRRENLGFYLAVLRMAALFCFLQLVFEFVSRRPMGAMQFGLVGIHLVLVVWLASGMIAGDFAAHVSGQWHWVWLRAWREGVDLRHHAGWSLLLGLSGAAIFCALPPLATAVLPGTYWLSWPAGFLQNSWMPGLNTVMPHLFFSSAAFLSAISAFPSRPGAGGWSWLWRAMCIVLGTAAALLETNLFGPIAATLGLALAITLAGRYLFLIGGALTAFLAVALSEPLLATLILAGHAANNGMQTLSWAWPGVALFPALVILGVWLVRSSDCAELPVTTPKDAEPIFETERNRLDREFELARQAQQKLLPGKTPQLERFALSAICQPAREVGGDLYEFTALPDGRMLLSVADVSGKGMPAALYMTMTKGVLMAASQETADIARIATAVNEQMHRSAARKVFLTAVFAVLDPATGEVEYLRAGHNPAILCGPPGKEVGYLQQPGLGLGLTGTAIFAKHLHPSRFRMTPGEMLILYSDGIPEAMNQAGELFGEDRLLDTVRQARGLNAEEMRNQILRAVEKHARGTEPNDDITLLILEAKPLSPQPVH